MHSTLLWLGTSCTSVTLARTACKSFLSPGSIAAQSRARGGRPSNCASRRAASTSSRARIRKGNGRRRVRPLDYVDGELKSEDDVAEAYGAYFSQKASDVRGHRVLVLSLQGEILHVITHPTISTAVFTSICCFDGKLMAAYEEDEPYQKIAGVLALQGL